MGILILRTVVMYVTLILTMRLMGKRQAGEMEISDLAVTFMLSELAVLPISDQRISLPHAILSIGVLLSLEIILSLIISRSSLFKRILVGRPCVIIRKGVLNQRALSSLRMSLSELMGEMRLKGIASLSEVEYAIIEDNGQLSVFKKNSISAANDKGDKQGSSEKGIAHCIIIEGRIYGENLALSGKSKAWVLDKLRDQNLSMEDIFLMTVDDSDDIFIILKESFAS